MLHAGVLSRISCSCVGIGTHLESGVAVRGTTPADAGLHVEVTAATTVAIIQDVDKLPDSITFLVWRPPRLKFE